MRRVKALILEHGWTQVFAGKMSFVDGARVNLIVNGRATPPRSGIELKRLALALGWPADRAGELLDEVEGPASVPPANRINAASPVPPTSSADAPTSGSGLTASAGVLRRVRERDRAAAGG